MKTKGLFLAMCLLVVFVTNAATIKGNGNVVTKEISISDFESVTIGGNITHNNAVNIVKKKESHAFKYSQKTGRSSLCITMDENLIPHLDIQSANGKLTIRTANRDKLIPTRFRIVASSEKLNKAAVSGSMDLIFETPFKSDKLEVSVSGAGDIIMKKNVELDYIKFSISGAGDVEVENLLCQAIEGKISGAGDISLKGRAETAKFSVSGAGDVDAYDLIAKNVSASVSGAGDIEVYASERLEASVSGIGDISYKGNPEVKSRKSGMGSIKKQ